MHTTHIEVEGISYYCNHNGDFSGDVDIYRARPFEPPPDQLIATIPFTIMEELVGQKLMDEEISRLQAMSGKDFLHATYVITNTE